MVNRTNRRQPRERRVRYELSYRPGCRFPVETLWNKSPDVDPEGFRNGSDRAIGTMVFDSLHGSWYYFLAGFSIDSDTGRITSLIRCETCPAAQCDAREPFVQDNETLTGQVGCFSTSTAPVSCATRDGRHCVWPFDTTAEVLYPTMNWNVRSCSRSIVSSFSMKWCCCRVLVAPA